MCQKPCLGVTRPARQELRRKMVTSRGGNGVAVLGFGLAALSVSVAMGWGPLWDGVRDYRGWAVSQPLNATGERQRDDSQQYAIVIDAGSTGSRMFVYRFMYVDGDNGGSKRDIECVSSKKAIPGLSSYEEEPEKAVEYMRPLFLHAEQVVPVSLQPQTSVYIQATAGMRLVSEERQEAIYDALYDGLSRDPGLRFRFSRRNIATLSGRLEGFYAALSVNYLSGRMNAHLEPHGSHKEAIIGALDLGGSSTQIVFQHVDDNEMELDESDFWVQSYLAYGVDTIRYRLWSYLIRETVPDESMQVENPCSFVEHVEHFKGYRLVGTGRADVCGERIRKMLWDDMHEKCSAEQPCGIDGIRHPPLTGQFLAMSVFFFALDCMKQLGPVDLPHWPSPSLDEIEHAAAKFCGQDWKSVTASHTDETHKFTRDELLPYRCVEVVYIHELLSNGYGFPGDSRNITFVLNLGGNEVEWTLGYAMSVGGGERDGKGVEMRQPSPVVVTKQVGAGGQHEAFKAFTEPMHASSSLEGLSAEECMEVHA